MSNSDINPYGKYVRKPAKNQVVRLDHDHFNKIEVLRALYSNEFNSPSTADIIRVVLQYYVDKVIDQNDKILAQMAVRQVMEEQEKE